MLIHQIILVIRRKIMLQKAEKVLDLTQVSFTYQAENINIYGAFLHNYGRATDAVRRRCSSSQSFAHLTRQISCHGQPMSLDDLLHKPVARVQKNALVLHVSSLTLFNCSLIGKDICFMLFKGISYKKRDFAAKEG